ncbi:MAG: hypothetical protein OEY99_02670 [Aigarchaeota archaeon]|nr:hypothetical protein [Aigarchaeota archaeon]MDH5703091.1 hypothetical protein [Aigarchaeota archaeon]
MSVTVVTVVVVVLLVVVEVSVSVIDVTVSVTVVVVSWPRARWGNKRLDSTRAKRRPRRTFISIVSY